MAGPEGRRAPQAGRRRRVVAGAGLGAAVLVAAAVLLVPAVRGGDDPSPSPSSTAATGTTRSDPPTTVTAPPARPSTATPTAPAALPPLEQRWRGDGAVTSDAPVGDDELQDGAFVALVRSVDASARTLTADVVLFYGGDDALAAAQARGDEVDDGTYVVNDVERDRVLGVADDARVGVWCFEAGDLRTVELAFADWAEHSEPGETTTCGVRGWPLPSLYWLDVRGGRVAQATEQYTP